MNPQKGEVPPAEREAFTKARPEPYRTMKRIAAREDARASLDANFGELRNQAVAKLWGNAHQPEVLITGKSHSLQSL